MFFFCIFFFFFLVSLLMYSSNKGFLCQFYISFDEWEGDGSELLGFNETVINCRFFFIFKITFSY